LSAVKWSTPARRDLVAAFEHIARDDPAAALRVVEAIAARGNWLGQFPHAGPSLADSNLRTFGVKGTAYILAYRVASGQVTIVRVYHAHQNWKFR